MRFACICMRKRAREQKKVSTSHFALAITVHRKADAALYKGNLNERYLKKKFLPQVNKYSTNEHSIS